MNFLNVKEATIPAEFDRRAFLLRNPLFRAMPADAIDALCAMAHVRRLPDRARLHDKGDRPDGLYAVIDGCIRATGSTPDGREALLALMEPGVWFGESSLLEDAPRAYCADAQGDCTLLVIPRAQLFALLDARPELYRCFVPLLCQRIRMSTQLLESNALLSLEGKLARRLVLLYQNALQGSGERPRRTLPVSQENLSQMIGTSRQSINKMLKEWEALGIVERHYGSITVLDPAALERLAET
ncbi:Crp/Fnr family transcriptional regulator [Massilia niastensis]|uniref:Crp/Fnr family transcriptional regulator n=1 Tax=Massilia niastensis TaxID=544911 RepID=UPI000376E2DB|nr:Crp/Fnr family transcriptional regulator [Massilia niastensis]